MKVEKTINLSLAGLDRNAFSLMGAFSKQARREGWSKEEINEVLKEAKNGDYGHLLCTLGDYCDEQNDDCEDDEDGFEVREESPGIERKNLNNTTDGEDR